jgi:hypothetical protein
MTNKEIKSVKRVPNPKGRTPGVPNKATANAREAISRLVDSNAERMQGWLDQIAEEQGPLAAWRCMSDVIEYHIPKLARTEHTGADGGAIQTSLTVHFGK